MKLKSIKAKGLNNASLNRLGRGDDYDDIGDFLISIPHRELNLIIWSIEAHIEKNPHEETATRVCEYCELLKSTRAAKSEAQDRYEVLREKRIKELTIEAEGKK